jgi:hypothetical protein
MIENRKISLWKGRRLICLKIRRITIKIGIRILLAKEKLKQEFHK